MPAPSLSLSSQTLGERFAADPELHLPERPRLMPELLQRPLGPASLLFEGARGIQVVGGRSARTLLPRVLPLLDGHRTLDELQAALAPLAPRAVRDIVALLFSRGLLEDGAAEPPPASLAALAAHAGRYNDVTRVNRHRGEALARLAQARVAVAGSPAAAGLAQAALEGQGLAALAPVAAPDDLAADTTLLLAVFEGGDAAAAPDWLAAAHARGIPALHAHVAGDAVEIGPLYMPGVSGCHDCFRQVRAAPQGGPAPDLGFWMGVLGVHAINVIARIGPVKLFNTARVHLRTPEGRFYEKARLARLPGCPRCGLAGAGPRLHEPGGLVWLLHNAAHGITCQALRNPRDHQIHYAAANIQLTQEPPPPPAGAPTLALPEAAVLGVAPPWLSPPGAPRRTRPALADLAALLRFCAGHQVVQEDGRPVARRIAASGGGLGASQLYVVARKVTGLPRGIYHHDGLRHRLALLADADDELIAGALGLPSAELPPVVIVQVAEMTRLRQKYDKFAFRLASLDAGATQAGLHEVAHALGWRLHEYPGLRDKAMAQALHVPMAGHRHMVCHALGWGEPHGDEDPPDISLHHYMYADTLIEWSASLPGAAGPAAPGPVPLALPPAPVDDLATLLLARRSIRRFAPRPLAGKVVHALAGLADAVNAAREQRGGLALRMGLWAVLTAAADDLAPGVYRWQSGRLLQRCEALAPDQVEALGQQKGFARAPLLLLVTGDFGHTVRHYGARGYREMLMRAGAMLARAQYVAGSWGVGGCLWGGIAEEAWGPALQIDRYHDCPLFAASLGYRHDD
jgi:SagB-type dehydrogenase family enzyme